MAHPRHAALASRVGGVQPDAGDPPLDEYGPDRVARTALRWGVGGVAAIFLATGGLAIALHAVDRPGRDPRR